MKLKVTSVYLYFIQYVFVQCLEMRVAAQVTEYVTKCSRITIDENGTSVIHKQWCVKIVNTKLV